MNHYIIMVLISISLTIAAFVIPQKTPVFNFQPMLLLIFCFFGVKHVFDVLYFFFKKHFDKKAPNIMDGYMNELTQYMGSMSNGMSKQEEREASRHAVFEKITKGQMMMIDNPCPICKSNGEIDIDCGVCNGKGYIETKEDDFDISDEEK